MTTESIVEGVRRSRERAREWLKVPPNSPPWLDEENRAVWVVAHLLDKLEAAEAVQAALRETLRLRSEALAEARAETSRKSRVRSKARRLAAALKKLS